MSICNKNHRYLPEYDSLPDAQDNRNGDRHICAGCAYEEGLNDATQGNPRRTDLSHLPFSQAGTVRHKDAKAAYDEAYDYVMRKKR
ncbi:MAG: hypothetical protein E7498_07660 [Ruminococcus sp.]|nr:hypothetical protein [Ruminococcus sp.]